MPTNLKATLGTIIPTGTKSPLNIQSAQAIKNAPGVPNSVATDLINIAASVNSIHQTLASVPPGLSQLLLTDQQTGLVLGALGQLTYKGVQYTNYLSEIHVGDPLQTHNPSQALFNANLDGSVSIGQNGWLDIHDPFDGNAAWIGTRFDTQIITGAADNGAGLIRLTVTGTTLITGNTVQVRNMQLYGVPNATGTWIVTKIDANHVDLQASLFAGTFAAPLTLPAGIDTYSPTIDRVLQVAGAVTSGGLIKIQTAVAHGYETGDRTNLAGIVGVPANGQWTIKVVDATHFTLDGSTFSGVYASGGTSLRYFAGMLAQTIAIGTSFSNYNLRAFADGSLKINNATITLTSSAGQIIIDPTIPGITLYDGGGNPAVSMEIIQAVEGPLAISATTNATPDVITVTGATAAGYANGDTIHISNALGDTAINGYRTVDTIGIAGADTMRLRDFSGVLINGNGAYTGSGVSARYFAGLLAQTIAIGPSFTNYKLRAFADGTLIINGATLQNVTLTGSFTSIGGAAPNQLTLTINAGVLTISGAGTAAGTGTITIDGLMKAGAVTVTGSGALTLGTGNFTGTHAQNVGTGDSPSFAAVTAGIYNSGASTGFTGLLSAAVTAGKSVVGGIIVN